MNILIESLDENTVEQRDRWKTWRERTRHIADEIRQSGQIFPDTTELLREDRER
ncbi:MAG TPA: hypothetical protein VLC46_00585 [Thermoanaerobaculia bacterium]|jgi:hypothetical protein|nr:hypothetical protein [Thermoanaerobaculia bacterium]